MAASNTPTTSACAIRVLFGSHLGSSKRSYADQLEDGADLVEGKAVRKSPTVKQAAADVSRSDGARLCVEKAWLAGLEPPRPPPREEACKQLLAV